MKYSLLKELPTIASNLFFKYAIFLILEDSEGYDVTSFLTVAIPRL